VLPNEIESERLLTDLAGAVGIAGVWLGSSLLRLSIGSFDEVIFGDVERGVDASVKRVAERAISIFLALRAFDYSGFYVREDPLPEFASRLFRKIFHGDEDPSDDLWTAFTLARGTPAKIDILRDYLVTILGSKVKKSLLKKQKLMFRNCVFDSDCRMGALSAMVFSDPKRAMKLFRLANETEAARDSLRVRRRVWF
jgi:hypothetical protein